MEETIKRIKSHRGVRGVLIMNRDGVPIRTDLSQEDTDNYAKLVSELCIKASSVIRTLDSEDETSFLRIRSKKKEIMIAPDQDYILVVVQDPFET